MGGLGVALEESGLCEFVQFREHHGRRIGNLAVRATLRKSPNWQLNERMR